MSKNDDIMRKSNTVNYEHEKLEKEFVKHLVSDNMKLIAKEMSELKEYYS